MQEPGSDRSSPDDPSGQLLARLERAEGQREVFVSLARRLAGASTADAVMNAVCEASDRLLGWDFFYLVHRLPDGDRFRVVRVIDTVEGRRESFPGGDATLSEFSEPVQGVLAGRPLLVSRQTEDAPPRLILVGTDRPSASLIFAPVRCEDRVLGFLSAQSYTPGRYGESDLQVLQSIADAVAPALERVRAEEALREANDLLDQRVRERTAELVSINQRLQAEITERQRAEQALASSERKHRLLIELNAIGYVIIDDQGRVLDANQEYVRLTGRAGLDEILGRPVAEWTAERDIERNVEEIRRCLSKGFVRGLEITYRTLDGREVPVEINAAVLDTNEGVRILSHTRDISDRKRGEEELRRSEERFRLAMEATSDGLWDWDVATGRVYYSPAYFKMLGFDVEERPPQLTTWLDLVHPEDRDNAWKANEACVEGKVEFFETEFRMRHKNGGWRWILGRGKSIARNGTGRAIRLIGTHTDITERKKTERILLRKEKELRRLGNKADRQLEEERARISRELHDELGQVLTALNLNLAWLAGHIPKPPAAVKERLDESGQYVGRMMEVVRNLSKSLRPGALSHHGLVDAIRSHAAEFSQYAGIPCEIKVSPPDLEVSEPAATAAFRIAQEALTNVARHAKATRCRITMKVIAGRLLMKVCDNGVGLPPKKQWRAGSLGILGMRERAAILGGKVTLENDRPCGTCITIRLPLAARKPVPDEPYS